MHPNLAILLCCTAQVGDDVWRVSAWPDTDAKHVWDYQCRGLEYTQYHVQLLDHVCAMVCSLLGTGSLQQRLQVHNAKAALTGLSPCL